MNELSGMVSGTMGGTVVGTTSDLIYASSSALTRMRAMVLCVRKRQLPEAQPCWPRATRSCWAGEIVFIS